MKKRMVRRRPVVPLILCSSLVAVAALLTAGPTAAASSYTCTGVAATDMANLQPLINEGGTVYVSGVCHGNYYANTNVAIVGLAGGTLNGDANGTPVLRAYGPVTVTIRTLTITNGTALYGGGIDAYCSPIGYSCYSPTLNLISSTVTGNTAYYGGGLRVEGNTSLTMTGSTVSGNIAHYLGGGLDLWDAEASIDSSTFSSNTAAECCGGGINAQISDLQITNSRLLGNWAFGNGGGVNFGDAGSLPTAGRKLVPFGLTIVGSTIDHNQAAHWGGGGVENYAWSADSPMTITNTVISNNDAPGNELDGDSGGGGIHQDAGGYQAIATITDTKIYGNTAMNSYGGGISNVAYGHYGSARLILTNTWLQAASALPVGNRARWGGGIYNARSVASASVGAGSKIIRNRANVNGGGVYNDCGASLQIAPEALLSRNLPNDVFNSTGCLLH